MTKATDAVLSLVRAGAHIEVPAHKATDALVSIATACRAAGVTMRITECAAKPTDSLAAIVKAGGGCVTLLGL